MKDCWSMLLSYLELVLLLGIIVLVCTAKTSNYTLGLIAFFSLVMVVDVLYSISYLVGKLHSQTHSHATSLWQKFSFRIGHGHHHSHHHIAHGKKKKRRKTTKAKKEDSHFGNTTGNTRWKEVFNTVDAHDEEVTGSPLLKLNPFTHADNKDLAESNLQKDESKGKDESASKDNSLDAASGNVVKDQHTAQAVADKEEAEEAEEEEEEEEEEDESSSSSSEDSREYSLAHPIVIHLGNTFVRAGLRAPSEELDDGTEKGKDDLNVEKPAVVLSTAALLGEVLDPSQQQKISPSKPTNSPQRRSSLLAPNSSTKARRSSSFPASSNNNKESHNHATLFTHDGKLVNMAWFEAVLKIVYKKLGMRMLHNRQTHPLVLCMNPAALSSPESVRAICHVVFNQLQVKYLYLSTTSRAALYASQSHDGCVLTLGSQFSYTCGFCRGKVSPSSLHFTCIGGSKVTESLERLTLLQDNDRKEYFDSLFHRKSTQISSLLKSSQSRLTQHKENKTKMEVEDPQEYRTRILSLLNDYKHRHCRVRGERVSKAVEVMKVDNSDNHSVGSSNNSHDSHNTHNSHSHSSTGGRKGRSPSKSSINSTGGDLSEEEKYLSAEVLFRSSSRAGRASISVHPTVDAAGHTTAPSVTYPVLSLQAIVAECIRSLSHRNDEGDNDGSDSDNDFEGDKTIRVVLAGGSVALPNLKQRLLFELHLLQSSGAMDESLEIDLHLPQEYMIYHGAQVLASLEGFAHSYLSQEEYAHSADSVSAKFELPLDL